VAVGLEWYTSAIHKMTGTGFPDDLCDSLGYLLLRALAH